MVKLISWRLRCGVALSFAMVTAIPGGPVGYANTDDLPSYSIVDLGTLPQSPGGDCGATALNNRGEVVGGVGNNGATTSFAYVWRRGAMTDLSGFPGFTHSVADGINREGVVVGHSYNLSNFPSSFQSWFWRKNRFTAISTTLWPASINASDEVAGFVNEDSRTAAVWKDGVTTLLPSMGHQSDATAINRGGIVVGELYMSVHVGPLRTIPVPHAVLWWNGGVVDLGRLGSPPQPFDGEGAGATALNETTWVVGWSTTQSGYGHAFLWIWGHMRDLGTLPGYTESIARGINGRGDIVGQSGFYDTSLGLPINRAVLWHHGHVVDLNSLRPGSFSGTLQHAQAINDRGQIIGDYSAVPNPINSFNNRCFLMTPTD